MDALGSPALVAYSRVLIGCVFQREIDKLASLSLQHGATDEEISHCRVKRECIVLPPGEYI